MTNCTASTNETHNTSQRRIPNKETDFSSEATAKKTTHRTTPRHCSLVSSQLAIKRSQGRKVTTPRAWRHLASRKRERRIMIASQVLCLSCVSMFENFLRTHRTMTSISFCVTGRVWLCSRSRLTTCCVNSLQACKWRKLRIYREPERRNIFWRQVVKIK